MHTWSPLPLTPQETDALQAYLRYLIERTSAHTHAHTHTHTHNDNDSGDISASDRQLTSSRRWPAIRQSYQRATQGHLHLPRLQQRAHGMLGPG
jgi:hypothetical protein